MYVESLVLLLGSTTDDIKHIVCVHSLMKLEKKYFVFHVTYFYQIRSIISNTLKIFSEKLILSIDLTVGERLIGRAGRKLRHFENL